MKYIVGFILGILLSFSALANSFTADIGVSSVLTHEGVRYDVSTVVPSAHVAYAFDNGVKVSAGTQFSQFNKSTVTGLSEVSLAYTGSHTVDYSAYVTQRIWNGLLTKDNAVAGLSVGFAGIKGFYESNITSGVPNDSYFGLGYTLSVSDPISVSATLYGKDYAVQNVTRFNNAELAGKYSFGNGVQAVLAYSSGGRNVLNQTLPNVTTATLRYMW